MAFSEKIKTFIHNAWTDDCVCLVATVGADGPNVSPKGSLIIFDDGHLAYWERSKRKALANLSHDPRVVVVYSNMKAFREGRLQSAVLRFYGTAKVHESGPIKHAIFSKLNYREQKHEGADTGFGVLVKIDRAEDLRGRPLE